MFIDNVEYEYFILIFFILPFVTSTHSVVKNSSTYARLKLVSSGFNQIKLSPNRHWA